MNIFSVPFLKRFFARLRVGARPAVPEGTGDVHWNATTDTISIANAAGSAWEEYTLGAGGGVGSGGTGFTSYNAGDLLVGNSATTLSKLPSGATGKPLIADSTQPLGLKYGTLGSTGGGTGFSAYNIGDLLVGSSASMLSRITLSGVPDGYVLTKAGGVVAWQPNTSGGAPSDAPYITDGSVTGLSNERPLANVISSSAFASRPAATSGGGRLFFPTDAPVISRDQSSTWREWGTIYPLTPPTNVGTWVWLNQATGTVTESLSRIVLRAETFNASGTGGWETAGRYISAPSAPFTVVMAYKWVFHGWERAENASAGPCFFFRNSTTGELNIYALLQVYANELVISPHYLDALNEDTPSVFGTVYTAIRNLLGQQLVWVRITDNATTVNWDFSLDGQYWIPITSGNARLSGYNQIGFGFTSMRSFFPWGNQYGYLWLHHWSVT